MRRTLAVVFCILIAGASNFAQFTISDCKSGTSHNCDQGVTNFPLPTGAWVEFDYTSCQTSGNANIKGIANLARPIALRTWHELENQWN